MKNVSTINEKELKENEIDQEYENFVKSHYKGHFAQSIRWAKTKDEWDYETVVVRDENEKIKGSMLLLIRKVPGLNSSIVYLSLIHI